MYKIANCASGQEDHEEACRERRLLRKEEHKPRRKVANDKCLLASGFYIFQSNRTNVYKTFTKRPLEPNSHHFRNKTI